MPSLYHIQRRHAACYAQVLADLHAMYESRGAAMTTAFQRFEALWPQIKQGQAWAAAHADQDPELARLCYAYVWHSTMLMQSKGFSRERIRWIEAAIRVTEHPEALLFLFGALGEEYNAVRDYDQAVLMHDVALTSAEQLGFDEFAIATLAQKATALKNQGNYVEAKRCFDEAIKRRKQKLGLPPTFAMRNNMGNLLDEMGHPARALYNFERAEKIAQSQNHVLQQANVSLNMVAPLLKLKRAEEALQRAQAAHTLFESIGISAGLAKTRAMLAIVYNHLGNQALSAEYSQKASLVAADDRFDPDERYEFQRIEAIALEYASQPEAARDAARRSLSEAQSEDNKQEQLRALKKVGHLYQYQHHFVDARQMWQKALTLAVELNNLPDQIELTAAIGLTYIDGELTTAITYYKRALKLASQQKLLQNTANILANLGNAYLWTNQVAAAMRCYQQALERARIDQEPHIANRVQAYIGQWHLLQSRLEQAVSIFEETLSYFEQSNDWYYLAWMGHQYSIALWLSGKHDAAVTACRQALRRAEAAEIVPLIEQGTQALADMETALNGGEPYEPIVDIAIVHALASEQGKNAVITTDSPAQRQTELP